MSVEASDPREREQRLDEAIAAYFEQVDSGRTTTDEEWIERYPEFREELREFFEDRRHVDRFASPLRCAIQPSKSLECDQHLGDYLIHREIGRGGMGIVYEAEQMSLRRRVALKVLPFSAVMDDRQRKRFQNEAHAAALLRHPNIVGVLAVGCERGVHYYAMDLIQGQSLAEVIAQARHSEVKATDHKAGEHPETDTKHREFDSSHSATDTAPIAAVSTEHSSRSREFYRSAARLGVQAAEGLDYAHQEGVIHRDIKPSNLLLDENGKLWIADFGLAHVQSDRSLTITGDVLGTLRYMSPEQASGERSIVDHRTDVYSLGVTLYELLTLQPAFGGHDRQKLLREIGELEPPAPRKINGAIPRDLETIVLKAIAKEPHSRYRTASELAEDLQRFLEHKPIRARRTGRLNHLWRWAKRKPAVAALTATVVTLLLVLATAGPLAAIRQAALVRETRRSLYVSDVNSAYQAWDEANLDRVQRLLQRHVPQPGQEELRGFAWHHLWTQYQSVLLTPKLEHGSPVFSVAFSPDGRRLATAGRDGNVRIWDVDRREEIATISGPWERVNCVAFSPDGEMLAIGPFGDSVALWDIATVKELRKLEVALGDVLCLAFSRSGRLLAANEGPVIKIWEVDSGRHLHSLIGHEKDVNSLAFSPNERALASASRDHTVRVWNVDSGQYITSLLHNYILWSVAFSPDGKTLASSSFNYEIGLWDVKTWDKRSTLGLPGHSITSVTFSPDGRMLASAGRENTVRLWDPKTTKLLATIKGHSSDVKCVAFSPDGKTLATGSLDSRARLWDVTAYRPQQPREVSGSWKTPIVFSPDGRFVAAASTLYHPVTNADPEPTRIWNLPSGQKRVLRDHNCSVFAVAFSSDGEILITGGQQIDSGEGQVTLWDTNTGKELGKLTGHQKGIYSLASSPVRDVLASGDEMGVVKVWDLRKRTARFSISTDFDIVTALAFSRDGEILLAAGGQHVGGRRGLWKNCKVKLWHADAGDPVATLAAHRAIVMSAGFSPDGTLLATGSSDGTIKLWNVATWTEKLTIGAHSRWVFSLAFCPDGSLASGSPDTTVKLWQVPSGEELCTLKRIAAVDWVAFSPDGETLALSHPDKSVRLLHAAIERENWPVTLR